MLYLASRSPRRQQLLRALGRPFRVIPSRYVERLDPGAPPVWTVVRHAAGKAACAELPSVRSNRSLVIGADTVVAIDGRLLGKPATMAQAEQFLRQLSGRSHWVYTGLALWQPATRRRRISYARTRVMFHALTSQAIARWLRQGQPLDKAGGYAAQDAREWIMRIEGSSSNVIGLPLELLRRELTAFERISEEKYGEKYVNAQ